MIGGVVLVASAAIVLGVTSCTDSARTTAPGDAPQYFVTTTQLSMLNPKTHAMEVVPQEQTNRVMASIVTGGTTQDVAVIPTSARGISQGGSGSLVYDFKDSTGRMHHSVLLYGGSGPPMAVQAYMNKKLISTTALTWTRTSGGYYNSKSVMRVVNPNTGGQVGEYTQIGELTTTTKPCNPKLTDNCGPQQTVRRVSPIQKAIGLAVYGLAKACASTAAAQGCSYCFSECFQWWLIWAYSFGQVYSAAAADLAVPGAAMAALTQIGFASIALQGLVDCMVKADSRARGFSSAGTGMGGGGTGGGAPASDKTCLEGSFAAHCTTAFTL
jgi:hypothetical protein